MACFVCGGGHRGQDVLCDECKVQSRPNFQLLPAIPNVAFGGYFMPYNVPVQTMIRSIKFEGNDTLARYLSQQLHGVEIPSIVLESEVMVPVASHWVKQLFRGRHHIPSMFQSVISQHKQVELQALKRIGFSVPSYRLGRRDRVVDRYRFEWHGPEVSSITILDDIVTTGATVRALAQLFSGHGISTIVVLAMAHVEPIAS